MYMYTSSVPKCLTFRSFDINFDHLFYLKYFKIMKKLKYTLKIYYIIKYIIFDFLYYK
jgi:hypothetical protein